MQLIEQTTPAAERCRRTRRGGSTLAALQYRRRLAADTCKDRQQEARYEEHPGQDRGCARQDVGRATAGHEPACRPDPEPASFRALQQNHADQRKNKHQVDDDNDVLHQSNIRSNQTTPGFRPRRRHLAI